MDRLASMQLFVRIVERRSFSLAAADHGIPRSTATHAIKILEAHLKVKLLERTTRHVVPTLDGEHYYERCRSILSEVASVEESFTASEPSGHLRIDVHGNMFRRLLLPHFSAFTNKYPELTLHISDGDRLVDLVREGIDCVVRAGELEDSAMTVRRLGMLEEATVASPAYLADYGTPRSLEDLKRQNHRMIGFVSSRTGALLPLEFCENGEVRNILLPSPITVTSSDTSAALALAGYGLAQAPIHRYADDLAEGRLVEVLPAHRPTRTPVSVLYPQNRQLSPRIRVFVDWLAEVFAKLSR